MAVSAGRLVSARQEFVGGRQRGRIRPLVSAIVALLLLGSVATGWTSTAHAAKSSVLVIDGGQVAR